MIFLLPMYIMIFLVLNIHCTVDMINIDRYLIQVFSHIKLLKSGSRIISFFTLESYRDFEVIFLVLR